VCQHTGEVLDGVFVASSSALVFAVKDTAGNGRLVSVVPVSLFNVLHLNWTDYGVPLSFVPKGLAFVP